jgi:hypothetical protein
MWSSPSTYKLTSGNGHAGVVPLPHEAIFGVSLLSEDYCIRICILKLQYMFY